MITLFLKNIKESLINNKPYQKLITALQNKKYPIEIEGPEGLFLSIIITELKKKSTGSFLIIVPTEKNADELYRDISLLYKNVCCFPCWQNIPYRSISPQSVVSGNRVYNLVNIISGKTDVVITTLKGLLTPVPPPDYLNKYLFTIKKGKEINPVDLENRLISTGYLRVPKVTVRGEFALRGEVLDIFMFGYKDAVRIVFEFDKVDEIKLFDPLTQRSTIMMDEITIYPLKEIIWTDERIEYLKNKLNDIKVKSAFEGIIEDLYEKRFSFNEELLFPLSFSSATNLIDYFQNDSSFFFIDYERLESGNDVLQNEYKHLYAERSNKDTFLPEPDKLFFNFSDIYRKCIRKITRYSIKDSDKSRNRITFAYSEPRSFFGNIAYLKKELNSLKDSGYEITIFSESESQGFRLKHILKDLDIEVLPMSISSGFSLPDLKIMAIQENEIFGRRKRIPESIKKVKSSAIDTFVDLSPGDLVVHINYGIGRFNTIERIKAAGTERDYIKLEYADEEIVFIPIEQVNLIQRYIGRENKDTRLDKLGGISWEKRKNRVKKSVEDLAETLIELYSKRKQTTGFSFQKDTEWQMEFEAEFPYEETEDQLFCIKEVKQDMESRKPMDRLICGDVGYGKTEVAMRAVFKAVVGGKQAAFLAPTTILAEQHYENFKERFSRYPVRIEMLSRFISKNVQKDILKSIAAGEIDIIIGTHRILQKDVIFKNLGLMIVDEEQRFGVKDKERLKKLKTSIDSLTLTATPIPRTLHMSLLKIRDMSMITTPPHNRKPIKTFIREFNDDIVAEAIRRETARGGQVFYLHNRIETLENIQIYLQKIVPEVLVEIAHGQMTGTHLEDVMHRFIHKAFDVLISTTIIENGIDIPNVNTIIINRADMYGISQLYQLRGRVGRSDRLAYAYLLYPEKRSISEIAMKRLQIISDYTDLGSGFKIALKDLEIRGTGNLLGRQQHGEMLSVGFDMYLKLLDEAVSERKEDKGEEVPEVFLELVYSGYIPDSYIKEPVEKMEVYKKINSVEHESELSSVHYELQDRFGPLPEEVLSLLSLAEIRIICRKLFISAVKEKKGIVEVEFSKVAVLSVDRVLRLINESGGSVSLDPKKPNVLFLKTGIIGLSEKSEFIRERLQVLLP